MKTFRAVVFAGKERMSVTALPLPSCGAGDVLVRVAACGVCGGDVRSYFSGDQFTETRRVPGHEATGTVEMAGCEVKAWAPGDRIALAADVHCDECWYCSRGLFNLCVDLKILGKHIDGGLAQYILLTPEILRNGIVNRVPENLGLVEAALSEPLCSVLASHEELGIEPGESVAVVGCGPMGILHLLTLRMRGARVIAIDTRQERLARAARDFSAKAIVDASRADAFECIRALSGGPGADVAICAAPSAAAVRTAIAIVRRRGRVGLFGGMPAGEANAAIDLNAIHYGEKRLTGNFSYHPRYHRRALEVLASGAIDARRLITCYPLDDTERALHDIREGRVLKAVVIPDGGSLK